MTKAMKTAVLTAVALSTLQLHGQVVRYKDCFVDAEIWSLPKCALEERDGHQYVSKRYLPLFSFSNPQNLAWTNLPGAGWAYFNRQGLILVQNVAQWDNGPSPFHQGLVRIVSKGKWGLAKIDGTVAVPLKYDGILEPDEHDDRWKACMGCQTIPDGEYSKFEGGDWFWLNRTGRQIGKAEDVAATKK